MKKETYVQPRMKVVKLEPTEIICASQFSIQQQNESYEQETETVIKSWYE